MIIVYYSPSSPPEGESAYWIEAWQIKSCCGLARLFESNVVITLYTVIRRQVTPAV